LTREELEAAAAEVAEGEIEDLADDELMRLITIGQYLTDRCLAEIERRGLLEWSDGSPMLPYDSDHLVENVLTREPN